MVDEQDVLVEYRHTGCGVGHAGEFTDANVILRFFTHQPIGSGGDDGEA